MAIEKYFKILKKIQGQGLMNSFKKINLTNI